MIRRTVGTVLCAATLALSTPSLAEEAPQKPFGVWVEDVKQQAKGQGISQATLDRAFKDLEPIGRVLELDQRQPEFTRTFWDYLNRGVNDVRIERGRELLTKHRDLLWRLRETYGVPARYLVAFWGLETNFGDYTGGFPVIGALATLAHDPRRSEFFTNELMDALRILDGGHIALERMEGSWAGAMGQTQFMPSTFVRYAKDGSGDGKVDIWGSLPDVMESAANYLNQVGWKAGETWGREVQLPDGFDLELASLSVKKPLKAWRGLGVQRANGGALPVAAGMEGSIVLPAGYKGPAFLVYDNFRTIMVWNRSIFYALAVGNLADRIVGKGPLVAKPSGDIAPLSRDQILGLQAALNKLGFDAGAPDGIVGSQTRLAVKAYQRKNGLPPDGFPTVTLINSVTSRVQ